MAEQHWQQARLIPTSGIKTQEEAERRATSALLAVVSSVREFAIALLKPLGAPTGQAGAFIEVPFELGERTVYPDGLIQTARGARERTALVEVKTGSAELTREQVESYLDGGTFASLARARSSSSAPQRRCVTGPERATVRMPIDGHPRRWTFPLVAAMAAVVFCASCGASDEGFSTEAACQYLSRHTLSSTPIGRDGKEDHPDRLVKFYATVTEETAVKTAPGRTRKQLLASARSARSEVWTDVDDWRNRPEQATLRATCAPFFSTSATTTTAA